MGSVHITMEDIEHKLLMDKNLRELMCGADKLKCDELQNFIKYVKNENRQSIKDVV